MKLAFKKSNLLEYYVMALLSIGLPLIAIIYLDWQAAFATFIITQLIIGLLALRSSEDSITESSNMKAETE